MAAARDAYHPRKPDVRSEVIKARNPSPHPDDEGWRQVTHMQKKMKKKIKAPLPKFKPSKIQSKVPADLLRLCFNCFAKDHIAHFCPNATCFLHCRELGHQAHECTQPQVLLGDKWPCRQMQVP
jgi:hypothetical protein